MSQNLSLASSSVNPCIMKKFIISLATLKYVSALQRITKSQLDSPNGSGTTTEEDNLVIS